MWVQRLVGEGGREESCGQKRDSMEIISQDDLTISFSLGRSQRVVSTRPVTSSVKGLSLPEVSPVHRACRLILL